MIRLGLSPLQAGLWTAPPERAGAASAMSETGAEFGGAMGIAILGSIGTAIYRGCMADALPAGLASPADLEAARSTLGGAVALAVELSGAAGAALLDAGRLALPRGLQASAAIGAVLLLAMAGVVFFALGRPGAKPLCADNPAP